jgi:hypothetical protein
MKIKENMTNNNNNKCPKAQKPNQIGYNFLTYLLTQVIVLLLSTTQSNIFYILKNNNSIHPTPKFKPMVTEYDSLASVIKQSTQQRGGGKEGTKRKDSIWSQKCKTQSGSLWDIRTN